MRILAIETSCDETAIAIVEFFGPRKAPSFRVSSNIISSQVKLHSPFGGVVPNLAKREHQKNLVPILLRALSEAGFKKLKAKNKKPMAENKIFLILKRESELLKKFIKHIVSLKPPPIDALAVTYGPGLEPALWTGVNFARALSYWWEKPLMPINHMEGHLYSALMESKARNKKCQLLPIHFPALALLVSGGHTQLVLTKKLGNYKIIGETLDDAAGEAFDKVARMLGLGYPGGPEISRLAILGDPKKYPLPSPMINSNDSNFSFSGLKTAVLYKLRDIPQTRKNKAHIAASFEKAVVDVLVKKTVNAAKKYKVKTVLLGGGVAANGLLRAKLSLAISKELIGTALYIPPLGLTGDNALMIALAAYFSGNKMAWTKVQAHANLHF